MELEFRLKEYECSAKTLRDNGVEVVTWRESLDKDMSDWQAVSIGRVYSCPICGADVVEAGIAEMCARHLNEAHGFPEYKGDGGEGYAVVRFVFCGFFVTTPAGEVVTVKRI